MEVTIDQSNQLQQHATTVSSRKELNHRLVSPPSFHACGDGRTVVVTEHRISVLTHRSNNGAADVEINAKLDVFFTVSEIIENESDDYFFRKILCGAKSSSPEKQASLYVNHLGMENADECIIYLQGGPGFGASPPICGLGLGDSSSWAGKALSRGFKRIVLMDQRGTGKSSPITKQTLQNRFPDLFIFDDPDEGGSGFLLTKDQTIDQLQIAYPDQSKNVVTALKESVDFLSCFRADNIVQDAECVKNALLMVPTIGSESKPRPWGAALGQSFGGFCLMTYLSQIEDPPKVCIFTGGIAPMLSSCDDIYTLLWEAVKERNLRYYDKYPGDIETVKKIVRLLLSDPPALPSGGSLTARRFLQLGVSLGGSPASFASLHSLLTTALVEYGGCDGENQEEFSRAFLKFMDSVQPFDNHPLYFLLHESIYCDGPKSSPANWSAHRMFEKISSIQPEYDFEFTSQTNSSDHRPTLFFGEMIFPWMADGDYAELSGFGMKALAHAIAKKDDWGQLYDAEKMRLALGDGWKSKATAAIYFDDMYVSFDACMKVTKRGGPMEKCKVWITNEYQHSGLRDDGEQVFDKLLGMAKGSIQTPS
mmetsp:Transcript_17631/g.20296  ORF Transcript_17631/g.20296 Transcript_17631/m.20296 type:complete len:593 (-) Transcript_17631:85-1863(-)